MPFPLYLPVSDFFKLLFLIALSLLLVILAICSLLLLSLLADMKDLTSPRPRQNEQMCWFEIKSQVFSGRNPEHVSPEPDDKYVF